MLKNIGILVENSPTSCSFYIAKGICGLATFFTRKGFSINNSLDMAKKIHTRLCILNHKKSKCNQNCIKFEQANRNSYV